MAVAWGNILNGDTLLSIRTAINSFSNSVVSNINSIESSIVGINSSLLNKASTTDVIANTENIATNTSSISDIVTNLNNREFAYTKVPSLTVDSTTYTDIGTLNVADLKGGDYKLTLSMIFSLDNTNTSAYFRFSVDGGVSWVEVRREAKDVLDKMPEAYITILTLPNGSVDIIVQARKESAADTLEILDHNIILERKDIELLMLRV